MGITCPWCGESHYSEDGARLRGALGARVRKVTTTIVEIQALPTTHKTVVAIHVLEQLVASIVG